MKIYLISQEVNTNYDTYDSAVVIAENEEEAKRICPSSFYGYDQNTNNFISDSENKKNQRNENDIVSSWSPSPDYVKAEYLGEAKEGSKKEVILASFNAG
jgi:hypothetical protein